MATWPVGGYLPQNSATIWLGRLESINYTVYTERKETQIPSYV
jgi:hypothetical protein